MGILQIRLETIEQMQEVLELLKKLHVEYQVLDSDELVDELPDSHLNDAYAASLPVLADDWDNPINDHWDQL